MKSAVVDHLEPEFEPVAAVWSDENPNGALEFKVRKRFRDDTLTLTIPMPLFLRIEQEADNSVLQIPGWTKLRPGN